jgi:Tfp pilus assembly protein PilF
MNLVEILQRAMQSHSAGNLSRAEELYNKVLSADARQFDALHMLGILHCQRRNFDEAVALFNRAPEVRPLFFIRLLPVRTQGELLGFV